MIFQFTNALKFYMLKSSKTRRNQEASYKQRNIVRFKDKMFFWEDKGRFIDRMESNIK